MLGKWSVSHWPELQFDVFLSHCAEDRSRLVFPIYQKLLDKALVPWLDRHHYPLITEPFDALRKNLLRCRHSAYFVTPRLLRQGRGWCATERTYAELIQRHFVHPSMTLWRFEIPLFFVERDDSRLTRSIYAPLLPIARWYAERRVRSLSRVDWAVAEIKAAIQEQRAELDTLRQHLASDAPLRDFVGGVAGFERRITSRLPDPIG